MKRKKKGRTTKQPEKKTNKMAFKCKWTKFSNHKK